MKLRKGVNGNQVPETDEAWKMYNFIIDWKIGAFGIMDLDTCIFGYYEQYQSK